MDKPLELYKHVIKAKFEHYHKLKKIADHLQAVQKKEKDMKFHINPYNQKAAVKRNQFLLEGF
jgi:hypothetical protein